ncbi:hypothetical protein LX32DRAFT_637008 [Colletotrichum zoysiae]|uniref:Uncharacterized protein n=1 Tax=Colletotrichum zoysiae TaxID=1216348 RepID=A0AAD9HPP3_9PEZI|nr:hypothetical protein LX32DRAFT_637008 [Colletotrichum zoysiae]
MLSTINNDDNGRTNCTENATRVQGEKKVCGCTHTHTRTHTHTHTHARARGSAPVADDLHAASSLSILFVRFPPRT